jgi:urease accessory protein
MTPRVDVHERTVRVGLGAMACAFWPMRAEAHLVTTGMGPIYDGITHVLVSPDDLVPIVAMALLAGLNGSTAGRRTLFVLTGAWLGGGVTGFLAGQSPFPAFVTALSFLVLGALAALDRRLSPAVVSGLALAVGGLHGWLNGAGIAADQREWTGLLGIAVATFVLVALVAALAVSTRAAWARVALRVAGSWVAAIGLLLLGWSLRAAG